MRGNSRTIATDSDRRSTHDALLQCQKNVNKGYQCVVDLDLEQYFDTVDHSKLIQILSETIHDGRVISLIHKFLKCWNYDKRRKDYK
ncbi:reverse transcriptase domain-containing protein [Terrilactibacillus sp. S3-3]|nr:reverse transcriptase domain-containing protein [Terrilactibacillus sp. S3-3]